MKRRSLGLLSAIALSLLAASAPALAQQKTAKACRDEWRANKAAMQASGKTEKAYVAECTGKTAATQPTTPAAKPAPPAAANAPARTAPATAARPTPPRTTGRAPAGTAAAEFASEAQAKSRCPGDTVVWVNRDSKVYHFSGYKSYGTTKNGAYMCERDTASSGFHAAKNEKHP